MSHWQVRVRVPSSATDAERDSLFDAVADAVYDWEQRHATSYDVMVTGAPDDTIYVSPEQMARIDSAEPRDLPGLRALLASLKAAQND